MRPKSMRDIPTIQGLVRRSEPKTREQAVNEMARLEHEKSRLERELSIWQTNQKQTEQRLKRVEERLQLLRGLLVDGSDDGAAARSKRIAKTNGDEQGPNTGEGKGWKEIPLEY